MGGDFSPPPFRRKERLMNFRTLGKTTALVALLALCLALTGCYVPPDEITNNTQNLTVGSNNLPFDTLAPATDTPAPTPTPDMSQGGTGGNTGNGGTQPTINWNENWGTTTTNAPSGVTNAPSQSSGNTITVVTKAPTATPARGTSATAAPTSTTLKNGSTGSEVRQLQQRLKELGYLSGSVDGDFGASTEAAVIAFQQANGLTADGKAGKRTLEKLYSNSAVANTGSKATSTSRATNTPKPTATPNLSNARYLQLGSSGKDVRQLQQRLIDLGWLAGSADGEFGGSTQAAVKAFQKKSGIWNDGIAGPDTQAKLYASNAARASSPAASTGESLREGMNGDAVRALQKRLKALGYYSGTVDGDYGSGTTAAVTAFQQAKGLNADGIAGTKTLNALYADDAGSSSSGSGTSSGSNTSSTGYVVLQDGDNSEAVRSLQQQLKNLGYYSGSVDGKYGSGTIAAVSTFQQMNNLTVDGKAGPATQRALYGNNSGASATYATLREYDEGSAVTSLQYALYELGYYDGSINGVYGATTKDAVRAFQIANNLTPVDGVAGSKTLQRLYSSAAVSATAQNTTYITLRKGATGESVVELQDVLKQKGYLSEVTGVYDDATVAAVRAFQQNNGLSVDGNAGAETQRKLYGN